MNLFLWLGFDQIVDVSAWPKSGLVQGPGPDLGQRRLSGRSADGHHPAPPYLQQASSDCCWIAGSTASQCSRFITRASWTSRSKRGPQPASNRPLARDALVPAQGRSAPLAREALPRDHDPERGFTFQQRSSSFAAWRAPRNGPQATCDPRSGEMLECETPSPAFRRIATPMQPLVHPASNRNLHSQSNPRLRFSRTCR